MKPGLRPHNKKEKIMNLSEVMRGGTFCLGKAGLAEGTNAATVKTVAADGTTYINYAINGILYVKADTDNMDLTAAAAQAVSTSCIYLITLNAAGTLASVKGDEVLTADITAEKEALTWPEPAEDTCPIGAIRVDTNASTTFTAGTTDLGAGGITDTYYDLMAAPDTPLTS